MNKQDEVLFGTISYITILGWIIALLALRNGRTPFLTFHLRQALGINLTVLLLGWIPIIGWILAVVMLIFWIIALINALNYRTDPIPLFGELYQRIFEGIR
ncbi:MAG: hypothetical protein EOL88_05565 [Bacteroidia bacterium]|jgi:uncharacterized membrane protein|nr:hypothetical protein [Bacteroidales bacterium]NCD41544.1 hypothetical protein [Bacteroidia bacterium]MDD2323647.1 hypothetical protein [Bacteroidales bacterium]MDD3011045.1 hypothetical protein [Bacteroidales bacterium]MDD3961835.1 hypothetical protein [Bacteroidales bacterium]